MTDNQTFDERYEIQNVRVVNQLSFIEMVMAVALGIVGGGVLVLLVALVYT